MTREVEWIETDDADNATATATHAAATNKRHVVTKILASFSGSATKLLTYKHGSTTKFTQYVVNAQVIDIPEGIRAAENEAVSAELAASGAGSTIGTVTLMGYSTGA